ncbi:MAG: hypothetical protein JNJ83_10820 [Verrucomicrobiaceae bacterium]|nr:hypothetical protein [Verrucomicrobiaceae bacterium]
MVRILRLGVVAVFAVLGTRSLSAHSSEFIGAKLTTGPGRQLTVEITADYGENPMITSLNEARTSILANLEVQTEAGFVPLDMLAPIELAKHTQPDRSSPLPTDPSDKAHQLLRGTWKWQPPHGQKAVRFRVPEDVVHSTIFWLNDESLPQDKRKWSMLLGGDSTPEIPLPAEGRMQIPLVIGVIFVALATFLWVRRT